MNTEPHGAALQSGAPRTGSRHLRRIEQSTLLVAAALTAALIVRGICWEAIAWTAPVAAAIALIYRREVLVSVAAAAILVAGTVTVEIVDVGWYHSVSPFGAPRMMVWCGTDLAPQGPPIKISSTKGFERATGGGPVISYGVTPDGSAIVGAGGNAETFRCQWQVFVAVGNGQWLEYTQDPI